MQNILKSFHPVYPYKKLKANTAQGIEVGTEKIVIFKDHQGKVSALLDRCPHRFSNLSPGKVLKNGKIQCPYHGIQFDSDGKGIRPIDQKENKISCKVKSYKVVVKYNYIWIANSNVSEDSFPKLPNTDEWLLIDGYPIEFNQNLAVTLDNFSENEHFPFVHNFFGWDENSLDKLHFHCEKKDTTVHTLYWGPQRSFPGMRILYMKPGDYLHNSWETSFSPPLINYTTHLTNGDKKPTSPIGYVAKVLVFFVPMGENKTVVHIFQMAKFNHSFWKNIIKLFKPLYIRMCKNDIKNDLHLLDKLDPLPSSLEGMNLSRYDEPLKYNREFLEKFYYSK